MIGVCVKVEHFCMLLLECLRLVGVAKICQCLGGIEARVNALQGKVPENGA